jgi:preprotein translocase subunit YajC
MMHLIAMSPAGQDGQGGLFSSLIFLVPMILIFWLMIIRPQSKQRKEREKMLSAVKKGDKVVTAGGMHGEVVGTDEKILLIEVADNVKLKFDRSAVTTIIRESDAVEKTTK